MSLDRLIDKEPDSSLIFNRLMGYSILSLILVIYTFTSPSANLSTLHPSFLLIHFCYLPQIRKKKWLQYKYDKIQRKNVLFACEVYYCFLSFLQVVHLSRSMFTVIFAYFMLV